MALRAGFILVFVAVANCMPEGGIYVTPKQGTYVKPKQLCRYRMTIGNEWQEFTSPGYPNNYENSLRCVWIMRAQDPDAKLEIQCNEFDLEDSPGCRRDKLIFIEDREVVDRFCGQDPVEYYSSTNRVRIVFRTNRRNTAKGFKCQVRIDPGESTGPTEETTQPETTQPATTQPATTQPATTQPATTQPATTQPATTPSSSGGCKCGLTNPTRIVGGQEVNPKNKIPWQVGIKYNNGANYWCGGSIINTDYVLSAAHCFVNSDGSLDSIVGLVVGVADHNMYNTDDDVSGVTRLVEVERVIPHPNYSPQTSDNDIALLKLKEKLDLSAKEIGAVCLPADDSKTYTGMTGLASGWGTLQSGGSQPSVLQEVEVPVLDQSCLGLSVTANMLCAGLAEGGKDTCQGDSGGPLAVAIDSRYEQVGITSWGYGCAGANSPGVYARVSKFLDWIKSNTADATYCT